MENIKRVGIDKVSDVYGKLSMKEKISYGLGDLGSNLIYMMLTSFIMFFYTNVLGITLIVAGNIMLIARVWDAINDPIMGVIVDKTESKHGKARPYLLWLALPFAVASVLAFLSPELPMTGKVFYAAVSYILLTTVYTGINLPYGAMMPLMTRNSEERSSLSMYRMLGAFIGIIIVSAGALSMVEAFENPRVGYPVVMGIFGGLGAIMFLITFKNTQERVVVERPAKAVSLKESFKALFTNGPWIVIAINTLLNFIKMTFPSTIMLYYVIYFLGEGETTASLFLTLPTVAMLISIPFAPKIGEKFGKRNAVAMAIGFGMISYIGGYLAGDNMMLALTLYSGGAIMGGIPFVLDYSMLADTVEYGYWKSGIRSEGLIYSAHSFATKFGPGLGAAIVGYALTAVGFQPEAAVQSERAILGIAMLMFGVPLIISLMQIFVLYFYKLSHEKYEEIVAQLEKNELHS